MNQTAVGEEKMSLNTLAQVKQLQPRSYPHSQQPEFGCVNVVICRPCKSCYCPESARNFFRGRNEKGPWKM